MNGVVLCHRGLHEMAGWNVLDKGTNVTCRSCHNNRQRQYRLRMKFGVHVLDHPDLEARAIPAQRRRTW